MPRFLGEGRFTADASSARGSRFFSSARQVGRVVGSSPIALSVGVQSERKLSEGSFHVLAPVDAAFAVYDEKLRLVFQSAGNSPSETQQQDIPRMQTSDCTSEDEHEGLVFQDWSLNEENLESRDVDTILALQHDITARDSVILLRSRCVEISQRGILIRRLHLPEDELDTFSCLEVLGDTILAVTTHGYLFKLSRNDHKSWTTAYEARRRIPIAPMGEVRAKCHPPTYLNKILFGSSDGDLLLYNFATDHLVHRYTSHQPLSGSRHSGITCLCSGEALDIVAVGFLCGCVSIIHAWDDHLVVALPCGGCHAASLAEGIPATQAPHQTDAISCICFGAPPDDDLLLLGRAGCGDIEIWSLGQLQCTQCIANAHIKGVTTLLRLPSSGSFISSGKDNSLLMWSLNQPAQRLVEQRKRRGILGQVDCATLYDADYDEPNSGIGRQEMIVASSSRYGGADGCATATLMRVSLTQQDRNTQFSQSTVKKWRVSTQRSDRPSWINSRVKPLGGLRRGELPPITHIASCHMRQSQWASVATTHRDTHEVHLWDASSCTLLPTFLSLPQDATMDITGNSVLFGLSGRDRPVATALAVAYSGDIAVVGYADGQVHAFNLQSGRWKRDFPSSEKDLARAEKTSNNGRNPSDRGGVCHIAIAAPATIVVVRSIRGDSSRPSIARAITLHDVDTGMLLKEYPLPSDDAGEEQAVAICATCYMSFLYIGTLQKKLVIIDTDTGSFLRSFSLPGTPQNIAVSPDGRYLAVTCEGGHFVIEDVLAARCVDWLMFSTNVQCALFRASGAAVMLGLPHRPDALHAFTIRHLLHEYRGGPFLSVCTEAVWTDIPSCRKIQREGKASTVPSTPALVKQKLQELPEHTHDREEVRLSGLTSRRINNIFICDEIADRNQASLAYHAVQEEAKPDFFLSSRGASFFLEPSMKKTSGERETASESGGGAMRRASHLRISPESEDANSVSLSLSESDALVSHKSNGLRGEDVDELMKRKLSDWKRATPQQLSLLLLRAIPCFDPATATPDLLLELDEAVLATLSTFHTLVVSRREFDLAQTMLRVLLKTHYESIASTLTRSKKAATIVAAIVTTLSADVSRLEKQSMLAVAQVKYLTHDTIV